MSNQQAEVTENRFHYSVDSNAVVRTGGHIIPIPTQEIKISYNFLTHFHPFVGKLIEQLNRKSLAGLFDVDFQSNLVADFFKDEYDPNQTDTIQVNYPKKEIDLDENGSYSVYNWELLFHVPITIASHLSKNQRFAAAQKWYHYIFDPTSNDTSIDPPLRFWKFRRFREKTDVQLINELMMQLDDPGQSDVKDQILRSIEAWHNKPFQPHVIARTRFLAYQFHVVMKYLDNLIAWGDSLFRQDTIETINEATQIYVLAANILGPRPQEVPRRGKKRPMTYAMLKKKLDAFGNALVDMEGDFPFNLNVPSTSDNNATNTVTSPQTNSIFGIAKTLYFCIPQNDKLLGYWDIVSDRLFKIRHCMNIEGVVRQLPLFEPPIDPGLLVKAAAAGIDISSVVSGLNQPISLIRAPLLIQKALEICSEVKALGGSFLSILEKGDAEALALLRQGQEIKMLQLMEDVKYLQLKESESATEALLKTRQVTYQRYRHYQLLLGAKDENLRNIKDIAIEKKELNEDNFDEVYNELVAKYGNPIKLEDYHKEQTGIDDVGSAIGTNSGNLQLSSSENRELNVFMPGAHDLQQGSSALEAVASVMSLIPDFNAMGAPLGCGFSVAFGGRELSTYASFMARIIRLTADDLTYAASRAAKFASYERRLEDWVLQNNVAASELMQIGRQIISSLIREQITKKEYDNHKEQIKNAQEIDTFLQEKKFTNQDLYLWMQGELSRIYYDCYKFAFDIAKKAEQTMKHELMRKEVDDMDFIKFNYWDSGRKGLLSGEALYLDLKRMEMAYYENNKREYEITKHVSLQQLNPRALLQLKATGSCEIKIPEWIFDLDCPSHFNRRFKAVGVSIPSVVGPYASINCTLSLLKSTIRKSALLKDGEYTRQGSEDDRFVDYYGAIQSIVTSNAQNDSGMFETNLRDERYLPFEGAGAESTWKLELPIDFKQFDYNTISDIILHLRYTAREGGDLLKSKSVSQINDIVADAKASGLARSFSLRHDFPTEWYRFVSTSDEKEGIKVTISRQHFPYLTQSFKINVSKIELFSISDTDIVRRNVADVDLDKFSEGINNSGNGHDSDDNKLTITADTEVLTRNKEAEVLLVLSYSLEK